LGAVWLGKMSLPFGISAWKQYADLKYQSPGLQLQQATNVSGKIALEYVSAETHLSLYDILFPKENETLEVILPKSPSSFRG